VHRASLIADCRNESFKFTAGPMTPKIYVWVHDHKTLGKDKDLAEGEVDVSIRSLPILTFLSRKFIDLAAHRTRLGFVSC
jgi:hypothetical protein